MSGEDDKTPKQAEPDSMEGRVQISYIEAPWARALVAYDEIMKEREKIVNMSSYKYHDFWDTLVKDMDHIVKKAEGQEDDEEEVEDIFQM